MILFLASFGAGCIFGGIVMFIWAGRRYEQQYKNDLAFTAKKNRQLMETVSKFGTEGLGGGKF